MANKQFGNILRELRNQKDYTQQQVADMLNLKNKSTLGSWEVGKSEPDAYTFLRLCKIYNVEDIYSTFVESLPSEFISNAQNEALSKYNLLNDEFKSVVNNLIELLVKIQEKIK